MKFRCLWKIGKLLKPAQTDGQLVADADVVGAFPNDVVANDDIPFHRNFMKDLDISLKNWPNVKMQTEGMIYSDLHGWLLSCWILWKPGKGRSSSSTDLWNKL